MNLIATSAQATEASMEVVKGETAAGSRFRNEHVGPTTSVSDEQPN